MGESPPNLIVMHVGAHFPSCRTRISNLIYGPFLQPSRLSVVFNVYLRQLHPVRPMNCLVSLFHMNFLKPSHPGSSSGFWANWNCVTGGFLAAPVSLAVSLAMLPSFLSAAPFPILLACSALLGRSIDESKTYHGTRGGCGLLIRNFNQASSLARSRPTGGRLARGLAEMRGRGWLFEERLGGRSKWLLYKNELDSGFFSFYLTAIHAPRLFPSSSFLLSVSDCPNLFFFSHAMIGRRRGRVIKPRSHSVDRQHRFGLKRVQGGGGEEAIITR